MFFFPKYSLTYPVEYTETAKAAIEITRIKNADNLSTKNPKFKKEEPDMDTEKVSPKITDNEKIIPDKDAIAALRNETYVESLSFLLKTIERSAPVRKKSISP